MSQPGDILSAVSSALGSVTGLNCYPKNPGKAVVPAAVCEIAEITAPTTFGTSADYTVRVRLLVQLGEFKDSDDRTNTLIDPAGATSASVFAALLGHAPDSQVKFEKGLVEYGNQQYAGGIFTFEVYA
jgi:hypothetical protein